MIHIAHISDIHFGGNFNKATWNSVVNTVIDFDPHLIAVSGDLVDDPSPEHLLAAKGALDELLQRTRDRSNERWNGKGRNAELVVVPGNHDVFESGISIGLPRLNWFDRVFQGGETKAAELALKNKLGVTCLGFDPVCLGMPARTRPQDAGWIRRKWTRAKALLAGRIIAPWNKPRDFARLLPRPTQTPMVRIPASTPVLLALLDSTQSNGRDVATGAVDNDVLIGLRSELAAATRPYVARIAIVHHHVLPIAFASGAERTTGEPMMVLRNAGAVLRVLADHKFDLILHGHWHKAQFARIDFGGDDSDSYPMGVASAGSAAMTTPDNTSFNSINLIRMMQTGQIEVKSVFYGAGESPTPNGKEGTHYHLYVEPLMAAKRRAYVRARERHPIACEEREQAFEITENGDLWITHRVKGLHIRGDIPSYPRRPLITQIPPYGHFVRSTLAVDDASARAGAEIEEAPDYPRRRPDDERHFLYFWLKLPGGGLTRGGEPVDYSFSHGCANCMKMSRWEAIQRADGGVAQEVYPAGFDNEWVGARVALPARKLILSVKFPASLVGVQPYVECRRPPDYPRYEIDEWGDAKLDLPKADTDGDEQDKRMWPDTIVENEAKRYLCYDAPSQTWLLEIDRPFVGYQYALRWKLPGEIENREIADNTREWQRALLNLGRRIDAGQTTTNDREAIKQFDLLCRTLEIELCWRSPDEKWTVALFVHDSKRLALRPVFSRRSGPAQEELPRGLEIPYGDGVSGAAFQQRRIIAWSRGAVISDARGSAPSLITPVHYPPTKDGPVETLNVLALPVYHTGSEDARRPPPWATIGVVTVDSSSYASTIKDMDDGQRRVLRALTQAQVDEIVRAAVRGRAPAAPET